MEKKRLKNVVIGTKVTGEQAEILKRVTERTGSTVYMLLNAVLSCFVKLCDDTHNLDPELEKAISGFNIFCSRDELDSVTGLARQKVAKAIYILNDPIKKRQNAVMVESCEGGKAIGTYNADRIISEAIRSAAPLLYRRLRNFAKERETNTITETLTELLAVNESDPDTEYIRELFSDCRRGEYGAEIEERPTKYVQHKNMVTLD